MRVYAHQSTIPDHMYCCSMPYDTAEGWYSFYSSEGYEVLAYHDGVCFWIAYGEHASLVNPSANKTWSSVAEIEADSSDFAAAVKASCPSLMPSSEIYGVDIYG